MHHFYLFITLKLALLSLKFLIRLTAVLCSTDTTVQQAAMVVKCVLARKIDI